MAPISSTELTIQGGVVTYTTPARLGAINRPISYSGPVSVSATFTPGLGCCGATNRYVSGFLFGNGGQLSTGGIEVLFYRGDINYQNSAVVLCLGVCDLGGVTEITLPSSFQFGAQINASVNIDSGGSITGSVSDASNTFTFDTGVWAIGLFTSDITIIDTGADVRNSSYIFGTVDNVTITYDTPAPEPSTTAIMVSALFLLYQVKRRRRTARSALSSE